MTGSIQILQIGVIFGLFLFLPTALAQTTEYSKRSLFSDYKAREVGDLITILIVEQVQAANAADTRESTDSEVGVTAQAGLTGTAVQPNASIRTTDQLTGSGETRRRETIRARLSAQIVGTDQYGNLQIEGKRVTTVNGETQTVTLRGTVRPADIMPNNTVLSTRIANMVLTIEGDGTVSETREPGLITKFLRILF